MTRSDSSKYRSLEPDYKALVEQSPVGMAVATGDDLIIRTVNPAYCNIVGKKADELVGQSLYSIIPDGEAELRPIVETVKSTGNPVQLQGHPHRPKSSSEDYTVIYQPYRDENSQTDGVAILCNSNPPEGLTQKKIKEREREWKNVIDSAPHPIGVYVGREMIITAANQAIKDVFGKGPDIIGKSYFKVLSELEGSGVFERLLEVYDTGVPYLAKNELVVLNVNGKPREAYYNYSFMPLRNEHGQIYGIVNTGADVTEITLANLKTEENEKRFRNLIEESPVATCLLTGPDHIITTANAIMLNRWEKTTDIIGLPLVEALPDLKDQPFVPILKEVYESGAALSQKSAKILRRVNGRIEKRYVDIYFKPLHDSKGKIYGILATSFDVTESVVADKKNRAIQRKLLASFEQSPVGIAILEKDLTFTMANKFYCELAGRPANELIGKHLLEAIPELKGQGFDQLLQGVLETGEAYTANDVFVQTIRNGKMQNYYVDLAYQPQFDEKGDVASILVVAIEVTQQVESRRAIEDREAKLASVIKAAGAGIALFAGPEMRIEIANDIMLGYWNTDSKVLGKPALEVVDDMKRPLFSDLLQQVYSTGQSATTSMPVQLDLGEGRRTYHLDYAFNPIHNAEGEIYGVVEVVQNVTESVISNQQIQAAESRLRAAIEQARLATWRYEIATDTFHFSDRFLEWTGFEKHSLDMASALEPIPPDDRARVETAILEVFKPNGTGTYEGEHTLTNIKTGKSRIIHAQATVEFDVDGEALSLIGTARDITQEQQQRQQLQHEIEKATEQLRIRNLELAEANKLLQESNAELAQFAYVASHDLQEPVRKISFFAEMLQSRMKSMDEKSAENLNKIRTSADRMGNLIRDILGFSQLSKQTIKFSKVDLNKIIKEILHDFDLVMEEKGATVEYDQLPIIEAIPLQMTQLFGNLISNSLKYSREGIPPRIKITHRKGDENSADDGMVQITLTDNGIGFDDKYATQIFNIFQRLHGKLEYQGTGIGLAMCKKIVINHNGTISATGQEGKGAEFILRLPIKQPTNK